MAVARRKSGRGASKLIQGTVSPQSGIAPGTVIAKPKKPFYKRPWFIALVVLYLIGSVFGGGNQKKPSGATADSQVEATQTSDAAESEAIGDAGSDAANDTGSEATDNAESDTGSSAAQSKDEASSLMIDIVAGEPGEYGTLLTMNAGTEFEETKYVYYVPAGRYRIENMDKYPTQASVYQGVHVTEEGWEEPENTGDVVVVGKDSVEAITVPEGYYIELAEPSHVLLTLVEPADGSGAGA